MATGLGKTVTFASIAKAAVERGRRVLIVAHTQELVKQARAAAERVIGCEVGVEMADERTSEGGSFVAPPPVVVGTIQTLTAKRGGKMRVEKFRPNDFGLVIFDEAHHSVAASWRKVANCFDSVRRLGVTATPDRSDGAALGALVGGVRLRLRHP
jgi:superfamily II DNA or RNA helicase